MAGAAPLVDSVDASSSDALTLTSEQRDDQLAANSRYTYTAAARNFIFAEDMESSMINHLVRLLIRFNRVSSLDSFLFLFSSLSLMFA